MKKLLVALAAVCAAGVLAGTVSANPDAGTVVASGFGCGILDGNGNTFVTNNSTLTLYANKVVLRCSGDGAPYLGPNPPRIFTIADTGLTCGMLDFGSTENWTDKVGRNGNSQLVCTILLGQRDGAASGGGAGLG
jgi:hypothetical protein